MAQSGYTPLALYHSATASSAPLAADLVAGELAINTADGIIYYKDSSGVVQEIAATGGGHLTWDAANQTVIVDATGALRVALGTTGQRPATPSVGDVRYNTTTPGFEGYQTIDGAVIGTLTNVTTTATATTNTPHNLTSGNTIVMSGCTPAAYNGTFVVTVTGTASFTYTMLSDPGSSASVIGSYVYNGWGAIGSGSGTIVGGPIIENNQVISVNYAMTVGNNGESVGPITVDAGVIVTIPTGSRWVIL
jgi:hypothetical protein